MSGQKGRDVLIKISDGVGSYLTAAGIRTSRFNCSAADIDGTSMDSPDAWRELVDGAGVKTVRVQGDGVFKSTASDARLRTLFFDGRKDQFQLVIPGFGILEGPFQVTALGYGGTYGGEATFSLTLESAGAINFTAVT
ncbi:MAG: phage major tail protein, TP901-1 family [Pseudomonadota bacterium]